MMMAVFERTREIGLLAAMGLKRLQILTLFLVEGVMIGILGAFVGGILGSAVILYLNRVGIAWATGDYSPVAALLGSRLYPSLDIELLVSRILMVGIITALASLYPAWQASHREPAEALHFV
jgi:ABC-type lipoprotein release transport system permease subunit